MAERLIAPVLKSGEPNKFRGFKSHSFRHERQLSDFSFFHFYPFFGPLGFCSFYKGSHLPTWCSGNITAFQAVVEGSIPFVGSTRKGFKMREIAFRVIDIDLWGSFCGKFPQPPQKDAGVAQQAEQLICNQQVGGSIPSASSSGSKTFAMEFYRNWSLL